MRPLEDIRIIAVEQYGAGPWGSMHLADLGAEVIKIEDPSTGGDVGRYIPPYNNGEDSLFYESFNRNKKSVALNLSDDEDRATFHELVKTADAVYSNLRGDVPKKLGITYETLKEFNPKIVCCMLTGYGMDGENAAKPAYDYMLQAAAGWMDITGEPGGPPGKSGLSMVDFSGGYVAALAMITGIHAAQRDGVGVDCDVSLYDTAISMLNYLGSWHLNAKHQPARTAKAAHPSLVPFQVFEAKDGWLSIGCPKEKFWTRLVEIVDLPELRAEDYATFADRFANKDELLRTLEDRFRSRDCAEWIEPIQAAGIPCEKVKTVEEALGDPAVIERDLVFETVHPYWGTTKNIASPVRVGDQSPPRVRAPRLGEHQAEILEEIQNSEPYGKRDENV